MESWKECSKEASRFKRSLSDFVDVENVLKSVHKARHPDEHAARKSSIIHEPIDWSKYPPSAYRRPSQVRPSMVLDEEDISEDFSYRKEKGERENREMKKEMIVADKDIDLLSMRAQSQPDSDHVTARKERFEAYNRKTPKGENRTSGRSRPDQIFSHRRPSTIEDQKVFFSQSWPVREYRIDRGQNTSLKNEKYDYQNTSGSHKLVDEDIWANCYDESITFSEHFV